MAESVTVPPVAPFATDSSAAHAAAASPVVRAKPVDQAPWFLESVIMRWVNWSIATFPCPFVQCKMKPLRAAAASPIVVMAAVATLLAALVPTDQARIEYSLCPTPQFVPLYISSIFFSACLHPVIKAARVEHPVMRHDLEAQITTLIVSSDDFVVVEGANRMGKSTLIQNVSASLSASCTVRMVNCTSDFTGERSCDCLLVATSWLTHDATTRCSSRRAHCAVHATWGLHGGLAALPRAPILEASGHLRGFWLYSQSHAAARIDDARASLCC